MIDVLCQLQNSLHPSSNTMIISIQTRSNTVHTRHLKKKIGYYRNGASRYQNDISSTLSLANRRITLTLVIPEIKGISIHHVNRLAISDLLNNTYAGNWQEAVPAAVLIPSRRVGESNTRAEHSTACDVTIPSGRVRRITCDVIAHGGATCRKLNTMVRQSRSCCLRAEYCIM